MPHPDGEDDTTVVTSKTRALREGEPPEITVGDESEVSDLVLEELGDEEPSAPQAPVLVESSGLTEGGRRRNNNEDALLMLPRAQLFAVADGMGDRAGGELASEVALDVLQRALVQGPLEGEADLMRPRRADELVRGFEMANRAVYRRAQRDADLQGMGTTLTALSTAADRGRAYIAHVGDSRCYRLRDGTLTQLTRDHTRGELFGVGPLANELSRAVGIESTVEIDVVVAEAAPGDVFLLCTDGLTSAVEDDEIASIASGPADLATRVRALVALANDRGGKDNITVVLVSVEAQS